MSSSIIPEIVGQTEILEESPMTPQELQRKVELETIIRSADLKIVSSSTFLCSSCGVIGDSSRISV